jgi:hypothetical protein
MRNFRRNNILWMTEPKASYLATYRGCYYFVATEYTGSVVGSDSMSSSYGASSLPWRVSSNTRQLSLRCFK